MDWRQVRIFASDFTDHWYFGLLTQFVIPFRDRYPETVFWFSRYVQTRNAWGEDFHDTNILALPTPFLSPANQHHSLRLRFCPGSDEELFLESRFTDAFWHSEFSAYDILGDLGGSRFCPSNEMNSRLRRTTLMARLLHCNCLLVLDSIRADQAFEENLDPQNAFSRSTFVSVLHLFINVYGDAAGRNLNAYILENPNGQPGAVARL